MTIVLFFAGLSCLIIGAAALVRGATRLADALGISPLVIGLTVVAFGTSSPELAVSIRAGLMGQAEIAAGNVVGSNIFNVLFILGISALIVPLVVSKRLVRQEVPLMLGLSVVVLVLGLDGTIGTIEGGALVVGLGVYMHFLIRQSHEQRIQERTASAGQSNEKGYFATSGSADPPRDPHSAGAGGRPRHAVNLALVVGGLVLLVMGSRWLVDSAVTFASVLGVSDTIVALTIVAAGTSLPEVATSVVAAVRGERDVAVGNVVGSNIFNLTGVLGLAAVAAPDGIDVSSALMRFDLPIMIGTAFACLPIFFTGQRISRLEGSLLLAYYAAYAAFLVLASTRHAVLPAFSNAMLYFVVPLTLLTLIIIAMREWRGAE